MLWLNVGSNRNYPNKHLVALQWASDGNEGAWKTVSLTLLVTRGPRLQVDPVLLDEASYKQI